MSDNSSERSSSQTSSKSGEEDMSPQAIKRRQIRKEKRKQTQKKQYKQRIKQMLREMPNLLPVQRQIFEELDGYMDAQEVLNEVIDKGSWILYLKYLKSKLAGHYAEWLTDILRELAIQEVRAYDPGENVENLLFFWNDEEEPTQPGLDSWSRLSLKINQPRPQSPKSGLIDSLQSISESSMGTSRLSRVGSSKMLKRPKGSQQSLGNSQAEQRKSKRQHHQQEEEWHIQQMPDDKPKEVEDETVNRLRREREEKKKQTAIEVDLKRKEQAKEKAKEEQKKNIEKQLKGQPFTYDFDGKVFVVSQPKTDQFPATQPVVVYNTKKPVEIINNVDVVPEYVEDSRIETKMKRAPPPVSYAKKLEKKNKKNEDEEVQQDPSVPFKAMNLREVFQVKPGVSLKFSGLEKAGPEIKVENRMKKSDYLELIRIKEKERQEYYKNIADRQTLDPVAETSSNSSKHLRKELKSSTVLSKQLEKLSEMNRLTEVQIHQQEQLIQMLVDDAVADPKKIEEEVKKKERLKVKLQRMKQEEEEKKRANEIGHRVVKYEQDLPSSGRKKDAPNKVYGINKMFDEYNKQLLKDENWGSQMGGAGRPKTAEVISPKMSTDKKQEQRVYDPHIKKNPRERGTVGQKFARKEGDVQDLAKSQMMKSNLSGGGGNNFDITSKNLGGEAKSMLRNTSAKGFLKPLSASNNHLPQLAKSQSEFGFKKPATSKSALRPGGMNQQPKSNHSSRPGTNMGSRLSPSMK